MKEMKFFVGHTDKEEWPELWRSPEEMRRGERGGASSVMEEWKGHLPYILKLHFC